MLCLLSVIIIFIVIVLINSQQIGIRFTTIQEKDIHTRSLEEA